MQEYQKVIARLERLARDRGLSFDPVFFRLTDSDEIAEVASMGLPNRFVHWLWGGAYKELSIQQAKEVFSILELVLNTSPSYAFLRHTNTYLQNVLVIAHVYGHVDFFRNNHWYRKSNKNMLNEAELHARIIRAYEAKYGREKVEELLNQMLTVATSVNAFERNPAERHKRLIYYLEEKFWESLRRRLQEALGLTDAELDQLALTEDVMDRLPADAAELVLKTHLLRMIREEAEYFDIIQRTHIINEGWATFVEAELLREILSTREWATISVQLSNRPAPYTIGYTLFKHIRDARGFDEVLRVRRDYDDIRLVDAVLTEEMVQRLDLFVYDPKEKSKSYDLHQVKDMLIAQKLYKGEPHIEVEPGDGGELVLRHHEEDKKLDPKRIERFLRAVRGLWGPNVRLWANGKCYPQPPAA
ncbi:MAG: SpoVR family protein [Armatimonadetes bacterium]|nr:SpoVR family protein [Armatimonadota bacterium]